MAAMNVPNQHKILKTRSSVTLFTYMCDKTSAPFVLKSKFFTLFQLTTHKWPVNYPFCTNIMNMKPDLQQDKTL